MVEQIREKLQIIDTNTLGTTISRTNEPIVKKARINNSAKILTFRSSEAPVNVQLLSTHTIHDLVDILCQETIIGDGESVYDHMWNVKINGKVFESGDNCELRANKTKLGDLKLAMNQLLELTYDYGMKFQCKIQLINQSDYTDTENTTEFPRREPKALPVGYMEYTTEGRTNLNNLFPRFNKWIFEEAENPELCLFNPGRKKHAGYVQRDDEHVTHMIYLPTKPGKDMGAYLHCFNHAASVKYSSNYEWCSIVVLPTIDSTSKFNHYKHGLERGFCECVTAPQSSIAINHSFPKVSALAGLSKDPSIPKGWICFKNDILQICSGSAKSREYEAPDGTAWDGKDQFKPKDTPLFETNIKIKSLHHLFCVVEGLLRTL